MAICGILNIDKPEGVTSRDVVDRVLRLVPRTKVGHAGTLDPLATGVLVVCVGHATRLINIIQEGRKQYVGRFVLGQHSDTDDRTGNVTPGGDWTAVTEERMSALLPDFTGCIRQVPPQFSAVHVQGRRAYDLARRGQSVELEARSVDVHAIRLTDFCPPEFALEIECGSGTYIRSIGRDLGRQLGCGALMTQLRRTEVGSFNVDDAISPDRLTFETLGQFLQPAITAVSFFRHRQLTMEEMIAVRRGQSIAAEVKSASPANSIVNDSLNDVSPLQRARAALIGIDGKLLGIGETDSTTGRLQPRIIFPGDPELHL